MILEFDNQTIQSFTPPEGLSDVRTQAQAVEPHSDLVKGVFQSLGKGVAEGPVVSLALEGLNKLESWRNPAVLPNGDINPDGNRLLSPEEAEQITGTKPKQPVTLFQAHAKKAQQDFATKLGEKAKVNLGDGLGSKLIGGFAEGAGKYAVSVMAGARFGTAYYQGKIGLKTLGLGEGLIASGEEFLVQLQKARYDENEDINWSEIVRTGLIAGGISASLGAIFGKAPIKDTYNTEKNKKFAKSEATEYAPKEDAIGTVELNSAKTVESLLEPKNLRESRRLKDEDILIKRNLEVEFEALEDAGNLAQAQQRLDIIKGLNDRLESNRKSFLKLNPKYARKLVKEADATAKQDLKNSLLKKQRELIRERDGQVYMDKTTYESLNKQIKELDLDIKGIDNKDYVPKTAEGFKKYVEKGQEFIDQFTEHVKYIKNNREMFFEELQAKDFTKYFSKETLDDILKSERLKSLVSMMSKEQVKQFAKDAPGMLKEFYKKARNGDYQISEFVKSNISLEKGSATTTALDFVDEKVFKSLAKKIDFDGLKQKAKSKKIELEKKYVDTFVEKVDRLGKATSKKIDEVPVLKKGKEKLQEGARVASKNLKEMGEELFGKDFVDFKEGLKKLPTTEIRKRIKEFDAKSFTEAKKLSFQAQNIMKSNFEKLKQKLPKLTREQLIKQVQDFDKNSLAKAKELAQKTKRSLVEISDEVFGEEYKKFKENIDNLSAAEIRKKIREFDTKSFTKFQDFANKKINKLKEQVDKLDKDAILKRLKDFDSSSLKKFEDLESKGEKFFGEAYKHVKGRIDKIKEKYPSQKEVVRRKAIEGANKVRNSLIPKAKQFLKEALKNLNKPKKRGPGNILQLVGDDKPVSLLDKKVLKIRKMIEDTNIDSFKSETEYFDYLGELRDELDKVKAFRLPLEERDPLTLFIELSHEEYGLKSLKDIIKGMDAIKKLDDLSFKRLSREGDFKGKTRKEIQEANDKFIEAELPPLEKRISEIKTAIRKQGNVVNIIDDVFKKIKKKKMDEIELELERVFKEEMDRVMKDREFRELPFEQKEKYQKLLWRNIRTEGERIRELKKMVQRKSFENIVLDFIGAIEGGLLNRKTYSTGSAFEYIRNSLVVQLEKMFLDYVIDAFKESQENDEKFVNTFLTMARTDFSFVQFKKAMQEFFGLESPAYTVLEEREE